MSSNATMASVRSLKIMFILSPGRKDYRSASGKMLQAYNLCKKLTDNVTWHNEKTFDSGQYTSPSKPMNKTDIIVLEEFEGELFNVLQHSKLLILGPICLIGCLTSNIPIPSLPSPIYNISLLNCVVTCTNLSIDTKRSIQTKVEWMSGRYSDLLLDTVTHLVTKSVNTEKYVKALKLGIKIVTPAWLDAVWTSGNAKHISCSSEDFDEFTCPAFLNLSLCSTGFQSSKERNELGDLIGANGGQLTGYLNMLQTDILIVCGVQGQKSDKFKAARKHGIKCVTTDWVYECVKKRACLSTELFPVKNVTSTPTKGDTASPNFSMVSVIGGPSNRTTFEETNISANLTDVNATLASNSMNDDVQDLLDQLDVTKAKAAGQYLDGCSIFFAGFKTEHREKLIKLVKTSGATRYDSMGMRVTHVIVGDANATEVKLVRSQPYNCVFVRLNWLLKSIEESHPADEEDYLLDSPIDGDSNHTHGGSPLTQKGLSLLRSNKTITENQLRLTDLSKQKAIAEQEELDEIYRIYKVKPSTDTPGPTVKDQETVDFMVQVLKNCSMELNPFSDRSKIHPTTPASTISSISTIPPDYWEPLNSEADYYGSGGKRIPILSAVKFSIMGFQDESFEMLSNLLSNAGGVVQREKPLKGVADYILLPTVHDILIPPQLVGELVSDIYLMECIQNKKLETNPKYYHSPIYLKPEWKPLKNCVITISNYAKFERIFLKSMIIALGATFQDQLARSTMVDKNLLGCSHLISVAMGKKYEAALKWNIPVVSNRWLLECAENGTYVPENDYLVGKSVAPELSLTHSTMSTMSTITPSSSFEGTPRQRSTLKDINSTLFGKVNNSLNVDSPTFTHAKSSTSAVAQDGCSQVTPVKTIMEAIRNSRLMGTPHPNTSGHAVNDVQTPETPLERHLTPTPNPALRKQVLRFINDLPDHSPPVTKKAEQTPMSALKRKFFERLNSEEDSAKRAKFPHVPSSEEEEMIMLAEQEEQKEREKQAELDRTIAEKLEEFDQMLKAAGPAVIKHIEKPLQPLTPPGGSDPLVVGWDYGDTQEDKKPQKVFMISGVDATVRAFLMEQIELLGGSSSSLNNYDSSATHLLCVHPARNEKVLACMAAGKWILHISYIKASQLAKKFENECDFEFGNPFQKLKTVDPEVLTRLSCSYRWRQDIAKRGYGAFYNVKAIVVAANRGPIIRVIEAGGGTVVDLPPPYDDSIYVTHCFLEPKCVTDYTQYEPLARQGVFCVNPIYISEFLYKSCIECRDFILPPLLKFYP